MTIINNNETWKPVPEYESLYAVSDSGKVKRIKKSSGAREGKLLKGSRTKKGYIDVVLSKDGKPKHFLVHRLVAMAFIPNLKSKSDVNHKDGNPSNNSVSNLEWCSRSENIKHSYSCLKRSSVCAGAKLTPDEVLEVRNHLSRGDKTQKEIAELFDISNQQVSKINLRQKWKDI